MGGAIVEGLIKGDYIQNEDICVSDPVRATRDKFADLKKHIQLMRKELLDFSAKQGEAEDVVQVNIQLFPLTRGL